MYIDFSNFVADWKRGKDEMRMIGHAGKMKDETDHHSRDIQD